MEPKFRPGQKVKALDDSEGFTAGDILTVQYSDDPADDDWHIALNECQGLYHRALFEAVPEPKVDLEDLRNRVLEAQVKNGTVKRLLDEVQLLLSQL